jgi:predicted AlkP superfamily pyrophosphatase or phosphodiesterase
MAKAAVLGENLGKDNIPDLLTISLSSTDYIGHSFGPASIELEDSFIKLDKELGTFLAFLDSSIGPNSYLLFLTSDHGVADIPGYLVEKKIPAGYINPDQLLRALETDLKGRFGDYNWVESYISNSLYLNDTSLSKTGVSRDSVVNEIKSFLYKEQHVFKVLDIKKLPNEVVDEGTKALLINGMFPARSEPDVSVLYEPNWIEGGPSGTTHSSIFTYDNHVPLMWYGFGIKPERDFESLNLTDIAPTITALLGLDKPNAATGRLIVPLIKNINGYERN